jgi:hypothetical protein
MTIEEMQGAMESIRRGADRLDAIMTGRKPPRHLVSINEPLMDPIDDQPVDRASFPRPHLVPDPDNEPARDDLLARS